MLGLISFFDPRRQFDVAMVNAGEVEISDSKSWYGGEWYVGVGWLGYGDEKTHSSLEYPPPKLARVS